MIRLFAGGDSHASYQAAKKAALDLATKSNKTLIILDGVEIKSASELLRHFEGISMFGEEKIVLIKRLFDNTSLLKFLEQHFEEVKDLELTIWEEGKVNSRSIWVKLLQKSGKVENFEEQKPREVEGWLSKLAKERGMKLKPSDIAWLVEHVGVDKWRLESELEKLALYSVATGEAPNVSTLEKIVGTDAAGDIWRFLDALTSGQKGKAVMELNKLMAFENNAQYLLSMLVRELTILAKVKASADAGKGDEGLGLHPFVLQKTKRKVSRFTWQKLQKLCQALLRLDLSIKEGRIDELTGLTLYVFSWP